VLNVEIVKVERASKSFGQDVALHEVTMSVQTGEFVGVIGPNGSGKSTLLRLLSGVESASGGSIFLRERSATTYSRKELAKWMAVLQQDALPPVGFTVREVIEMGRYPFQSWLGKDTVEGEALVDAILDRLELQDLADRSIEHLSGGQRQRVALGKVMAQEPLLLLLDEPTTFLDIGYQIQMMDYVRKWQEEFGLTVIAVLHDLNLAAQYCSKLFVIHEGRLLAEGTPAEVLTQSLIAEVYGTEPVLLDHPVSGVPQILLQRGE
jgi:iron complex transport system ATP-binding protein